MGVGKIYVYGINYNVLQIDDKGNSWLLHNLSKSTPKTISEKDLINLQTKRDKLEIDMKDYATNTI